MVTSWVTAPPPDPPLREIGGGSLKRELARVALQQRDEVEARDEAERSQQREIAALNTELVQEREARLTRESDTPAVSESRVHVDQKRRPTAP